MDEQLDKTKEFSFVKWLLCEVAIIMAKNFPDIIIFISYNWSWPDKIQTSQLNVSIRWTTITF